MSSSAGTGRPGSPRAQPAEPPSRAALARRIISAAVDEAHPAQVIHASRGLGKSTQLRRLGATLWQQGDRSILLEFDTLCTCPADFPALLAGEIRRQLGLGDGWPGQASHDLARQLEALAASPRPDPALAIDLALRLPAALAADFHRDLYILVDDLAEIGRFFRHAGLRGSLEAAAARLGEGRGARLIATVSPSARPARLLSAMHAAADGRLAVHPLDALPEEETMAIFERAGAPEPGAWFPATAGRPLYIEILAGQARSRTPAAALIDALRAPAGPLHQECRYDYHLLIERSRGDAAVRGILDLLAFQEGATVSEIARHLRVALPTALDYLSWLLEVGLIVRAGAGYLYADPLLKLWVRLNGPRPCDPAGEIEEFLRRPLELPALPARRRGRRPRKADAHRWEAPDEPAVAATPPPSPRANRRDDLIEID